MPTLTDHEAEQVRAIALWKSERSSRLLESYRVLTRPLSRLAAKVVPRSLAKEALDRLEALAEFHDQAADIVEAAGVSAVAELLDRPLEECDRLALMVSVHAEHLALLEGVVPAAIGVALPMGGGAAAAVADIPVLLEAAVRATRRVGHCYGFPLVGEADRRFVVAVLELANHAEAAGEVEDRLGIWAEGGSPALKDDGSEASSEIGSAVVDDLPIESIPIVGDVANLVMDYAFVRRVDATARRVFQERWLRANGKVESIAPASESGRRSSVEGLVAVSSEVAYAGAYGVAFGVTFPATLVALAVEAVAPEVVLRGFRDGASAATRDSKGFLDKFAREGEPAGISSLALAAGAG